MKTSIVNDTNTLFKEILDKFHSIDREDIHSINNFLNEYSMYFERNIFDSVKYKNYTGREYLNNEIINLLNSNINNFNIGDLIISDSLIKGNKINGLIFYYDASRCLKELNIDKSININIDFNNNNYSIDEDNISISLDDYNNHRDGDIYNLLKSRKIIKTYDEKFNRDNKNNIENLYYEISNYINNINIPDNLSDFIPNNYDIDLYSYKSLNDLLKSYEDSRLDKYIEEIEIYSKYRDVNSDDYYVLLNGIDIKGINEELLSSDFRDRYRAYDIDNRPLEENGYDKANLLPFIYIIIDFVSMGLKNGFLEDNWDNYKNLYEVIVRSQSLLREFNDYNELIKNNKFDLDDRLKVEFISFKLYDIYNDNNDLVDLWAKTNYIEKFEYNSDYYKGDMKSELDTMYLIDYLNKNKINIKKK